MNKVWWEALCNKEGLKHGKRGYKSNSSHYFVKVAAPNNKREQFTQGCPECKIERDNA